MHFVLSLPAGAGTEQRLEFAQDRVRIGRSAQNDVVLPGAGVSRVHARIERRGDRFRLLDAGSANGTDLNGAAISGAVPLETGDRISVGGVVLRFSLTPGHAGGRAEARLSSRGRTGRELARRLAAWICRRRAPCLAALLLAPAIGLLGARIVAPHRRAECPDVVDLDEGTSARSFGRGAADMDCGPRVQFGFVPPSSTRLLLHYTPSDIASARELEIELNGKHVAWAPASPGRGEEQVLALPLQPLLPGTRNLLSFAYADGTSRWSVAKVGLEKVAIAPGDARAARIAYERGRRKLEERRVAPRNLYDAWSAFAEAHRQLEGLDPLPQLIGEVARLVQGCERDLERECRKLVFSARRFERYGDDERAQQSWREILLHFPGEDPSGCRRTAQANLVSVETGDTG